MSISIPFIRTAVGVIGVTDGGTCRVFHKPFPQEASHRKEGNKHVGTVARFHIKPGMEGQLVEQFRAFEDANVPGVVAS